MTDVTTAEKDLPSHRSVSHFRNWVRNLWIDSCDERLVFKQNPLTAKQYWDTYKWWIKREYQHKRRLKEF